MKEKELVKILMNTNLINLCFKNIEIIEIKNEYCMYMNSVYKHLDIFVNCDNCVILIECKQQLKAHDIGQLLTYNLMYDKKHGKNVKLALAYIECRKDELNIIRSYIDKYNLGISLIHLYGDENNYKFNCFHHKTKSTIDILNDIDKDEICNYINIKDWIKYYINKYEHIIFNFSYIILINVKFLIILTILNDDFSKYLIMSMYLAPFAFIYPFYIIIKSFILAYKEYKRRSKKT